MHDIDRIRLETQPETGMFEAGPFEAEQFEFAQAETPYGEAVKCSARPSRWSSQAVCSR